MRRAVKLYVDDFINSEFFKVNFSMNKLAKAHL